jgi:hypothetical protein
LAAAVRLLNPAEPDGDKHCCLQLWTAIGCAVYLLVQAKDRSLCLAGRIFLALVAACALPYVAGFAYTRHISVLIYPAALMCCRALLPDDPTLPAP